MEYKITTIRDIFNKVPTDKVEQCMKELATGIIQAQSMNELFCDVAGALQGERPDYAVEWPETSIWIDDDKGEIDLSFVGDDGTSIELKTKVDVN